MTPSLPQGGHHMYVLGDKMNLTVRLDKEGQQCRYASGTLIKQFTQPHCQDHFVT